MCRVDPGDVVLKDRTALVTGRASGIGRGSARSVAVYGADVVVADVRAAPRRGGMPTHELVEAGIDASAAYVECDVADPADIGDVVAFLASDLASDVIGAEIVVDGGQTATFCGPVRPWPRRRSALPSGGLDRLASTPRPERPSAG